MGSVCLKDENKQKFMPSIDSYLVSEKDNVFHDSYICEEDSVFHDSNICVEKFQFLKYLGKGTFGKVKLVRHIDSQQLFAMKILNKNQIKNKRQRRHIQAERTILEQNNNTFIVKLRFAFQSDTKLYFVVDFVAGGELFYHLKWNGKFSFKIAQFYAAEILIALEYLHLQNIIYRDLKPENILLDLEGHIKLIDFGLAKICDDVDDYTYSICGTPEYLAPEILNGQGYSKSCDWWSYGAVLYEMLTGLPPFYSKKKQEILENVQLLQVPIPTHLPEKAQDILSKLLVRNHKERLGAREDAQELFNHAFFEGVDFQKLRRKEIEAPYKFEKEKPFKYFDQRLINGKSVKDTPQMENSKLQHFSNFTYTNNEQITECENGQ